MDRAAKYKAKVNFISKKIDVIKVYSYIGSEEIVPSLLYIREWVGGGWWQRGAKRGAELHPGTNTFHSYS